MVVTVGVDVSWAPLFERFEVEMTDEERQRRVIDQRFPLEFSHTLEDQIGGQLDVGFLITGFYEDSYGEEEDDPVARYMHTYLVTRAIKP